MLSAVLAALNGCSGFKPRTADSLTQVPLRGLLVFIENSPQTGAVWAGEQSAGGSEQQRFITVLRDGLQKWGARLVDSLQPGAIKLRVLNLKEDKTVSAYSSVRQVREFNHYTKLDFIAQRPLTSDRLNSSDKSPREVTATVRAERIQVYNSEYVLGVSEEEQTIRNELREEVVRLLALRLGVLRQ